MRLTNSLLAVALVVLVISGCKHPVSKQDFDNHRQAVQDYIGEPTQALTWTGPANNLRLWQLRIHSVVCRLERLNDADDKHIDNIDPQRLCPSDSDQDPNDQPPPPPDLGP